MQTRLSSSRLHTEKDVSLIAAQRQPRKAAEKASPMKDLHYKIDEIYIPTKRRSTLDPAKVEELAGSILEEGLRLPIMVRSDGKRLILVEGLQRLEACRSLGEETVIGILVQARQR